jgi:hypothetical protein
VSKVGLRVVVMVVEGIAVRDCIGVICCNKRDIC